MNGLCEKKAHRTILSAFCVSDCDSVCARDVQDKSVGILRPGFYKPITTFCAVAVQYTPITLTSARIILIIMVLN
jgi:hypothetical protein